MKIAILQADSVAEHILPHAGAQYPDLYIYWLSQSNPHAQFSVYDLRADQIPGDIQAYDAYVITGSKHSVNEPLVWINDACHFIRSCVDARKKVVGVCFGHQLLAMALGGKVEHSDKGWGIGIDQLSITLQESWMTPFKTHPYLIFSHQDQVVQLPPNSICLASSQHCDIQMFRQGKHALGMQCHPEMIPTHIIALIEDRSGCIDPHTVEAALESVNQCPGLDNVTLSHWVNNFFNPHCL